MLPSKAERRDVYGKYKSVDISRIPGISANPRRYFAPGSRR